MPKEAGVVTMCTVFSGTIPLIYSDLFRPSELQVYLNKLFNIMIIYASISYVFVVAYNIYTDFVPWQFF